jgi:hypothetical protein
MRIRLAPVLAAALSGCYGAPAVGAAIPGAGRATLEPTFSSIDNLVFTPRCATAACHSGTNGTPLSLAAESRYLDLINAPSQEVPEVPLVTPSAPSRSYLLLKLRGLQDSVGGSGDAMPPGDPLSDDELQVVETWISDGAPP